MSRVGSVRSLQLLLVTLAVAGCGPSDEEKVTGHPPLVVLVDRIELIKAGAADDPLTYLRRRGERLQAPRYEGYFHEDRDQAERIEEIVPSRADLQRFHTEFVEGQQFPGWPQEPRELEVAGVAMQAWVKAYPRLIEQIEPRTALVIAWDGIASSDRVGELAGG